MGHREASRGIQVSKGPMEEACRDIQAPIGAIWGSIRGHREALGAI